MKKKCIIGIAAVCILLFFVFIGSMLLSFPSEEYARALMDAMYREDFSDYMELTGESQEELEALYKEGIAAQARTFKTYFGITGLTPEGEGQLEEFVKMVYEYAKYEAASSKKDGENRIITVEVQPIAFYKMIDKEKFEKEFRQKTEDGEYLTLSEEEYQVEYLNQLIETYKKAFDESEYEYLDEEKYQLVLRKAGNSYIPSNDDFAKIDKALIAFSESRT